MALCSEPQGWGPALSTVPHPQHCLLGWDALPPKPEQSRTAKSLDLHAYVPLDLHSQNLPDASSALVQRGHQGCVRRIREGGSKPRTSPVGLFPTLTQGPLQAPHLPPDDDPAPETQKRIRWGLVT